MNLSDEYGMKQLLARCPNCEKDSLYCGKIPTSIRSLVNKEVLFCKLCKFLIPVNEFKKILSGT
ncbi:MAG: hypothetical protein K5793_02825 [Nitrosarchaeum sp.]|nr:hypothetical protein [Nitrosarchaeum sp.]MCV0399019.1 hypothetical protein [Nitrosarchaeum sp.]